MSKYYGKIRITRADHWFSKKIRIRDCFDGLQVGQCCTCGKIGHWLDMQCGHFVTRNKTMTRFHEKNAHMQCKNCNGRNKGEQGKHGLFIDKKYGAGTAQMLIDLGGMKAKQHSKEHLKRLSDQFRIEVKEMAKKKGIEL